MHLDQLYPPTFELSFDESDVILQIPDPDRVYWSGGDFLYNILRDFDLEYEIQYWIMVCQLNVWFVIDSLYKPSILRLSDGANVEHIFFGFVLLFSRQAKPLQGQTVWPQWEIRVLSKEKRSYTASLVYIL